jgi:FkbM family methyltransferase
MRTRTLAELEKLLLLNLLFVRLAKRHGILKSAAVSWQVAFRKKRLVKIKLSGIRHPVFLRPKTSDLHVFEQVFLREGYSQAACAAPKIIIDAGANIGLTSIYFANRYPDAQIYALEPDPSNFELLELNASKYPNIIPIKKALWKANTRLKILDPTVPKWAVRVTDRNGSDSEGSEWVEGTTVSDLMRTYRIQYIDILKLDIEGAEQEVFGTANEWIDSVGMISAELHDCMRRGCSRAFYDVTVDFNCEKRKGETVTVTRGAAHAVSRTDLA